MSEKKTNRFRADAGAFARRAGKWPRPAATGGAHVAVLVTPWLSTPVPFFTIECGLALRNAGARVSVLWDPMEIVGNVPDKKHADIIAGVLASLPPDMSVIDVSHRSAMEAAGDAGAARRIVYENAVRNVRGEMNIAQFFAAHPDTERQTRGHIARIRGLLTGAGLDWLLLPGGIYGVSAVYVDVARELGLAFSTFDSGPGRLRLAHDGIAGHLADLPRAFGLVARSLSPEALERGRESGREELRKRSSGTDDRGFQVAAAGGGEQRCDVLMPLNIRWDAAALSRQRLFDSVEENIAAVLDWAGAHGGVTVCIRQHPNERREHLRGSDNWESLVSRFARLGDRVRWIAAADPVSTYDLIRSARVVLPHTSTVGVEAALLGTPVVLATHVYYDGFPFVRAPATREEFFALLDLSMAGGLAVAPEARQDAALVYYLAQQCTVMRTRFTPQNDDFPHWIEVAPGELWAEPEPSDFLAAMNTREPLAALRARRNAETDPR